MAPDGALEFAAAVEEGRDREAIALYGGRFLDGCHLVTAAPFELWVDLQRARFSRQFRQIQRREIRSRDEVVDTSGAVDARNNFV